MPKITPRRASAMANTTPLVTTVTKPAINPGDADTTPRVNIQELCEEYYEDILPIIMKKVRHDRRKYVHTRLDFGDGPRERIREDSHHSNARARATEPERVKVQDRLRYGDCHVLDRLGHRRQSAFDRLSETSSPSTTKSRPQETDSRDPPRGRSRTRGLNTTKDDHPKDMECFRSAGESYDDSFSHSYRDGNRSRHMKRRMDNKSPPSSVSRSDSSDGKHHMSRTRMSNNVKTYDGMGDPEDHVKSFQAATQVERWAMPTWCHMFNSTLIGAPRVWFDELPPESIDSYKDLKAAFLAYFMQQKKYVKDPGAPECMRISRFMHGVNNPELTKRLNEHIPKTMEEMMITTTAFIRGEAAAASKKKGHMSWKAQDQSKRQNSDKRQKVTQSFERVKEITFPPLTANSGTEGPLIIKAEVGGHVIHRMYMDGGSSMEILYEHCFNRLQPEIKSQMVPATTSLTGFSGETIWPLGQLRLLVIIRNTNHSTRSWMNFMIVKSLSPYNGIIGRSGIRAIQAVPSTVHGMLKFPVEEGIVTIRSTVLIPTECTSVTASSVVSSKERTRPANLKVALHPNIPDQEVAIGGTLSDKGRTELCSILKKNLDIFAWKPSNMTGVPRSVAEHRLNIREGYSPVRQKKRGQAPERAKAIQAEVQKLVEAGIMREVYYHDWLFNPVMVKKHNGSWRMCVDFTDLNKACPQDYYPLPEIDWKVKSLCGYPFKCFLDAYKGYHQIQLAEPDEKKTAFHTGQGVYCYTKMPFGLKNAGATYQRLMDKAFESQIGQNIKVYVDDLVIKSHTEDEMMRDIEETFRTLCNVNMKLNPKKCSFGLAEGIFLWYIVTPEGIKPCPDKTSAVLQLPSSWTIKEAKNVGQRTDLSRFSHRNAGQKPTSRASGKNPTGTMNAFHGRLLLCSNNEAEYEALIAGLRIAAQMGVKDIHVSVDSKLVANQVLGTYIAKEDNMVKCPEQNHVNQLCTLVQAGVGRILKDKSITKKEVAIMIEEDEPTWMTLIVDYLNEGTLSKDKTKVRKLHLKARQYKLMEGSLYRQSFLTPWLRCVRPLQAEYVIREIHEGSCSMHAGPRSVVAKAIRLGYYWPTMHRDARDMIQKCKDCQIYRPVTRNPQQPLTPIMSPWPFYKWGIDIDGPFSKGPGKVKKFVWDNIVCRFGILGEIVSDNGKQFSDNPFKDWANRKLGEGIKSLLGEKNKNWVEEIPHVLWAHHTMIKSSHGDTPFSLTYETEVVIPTEIGMPTYRTTVVDVVSNDEELLLNLDLLEERCECAAIYEAKAKSKMTKYYNARVRGVTFKPGAFVYRSNNASHAVAGEKLGPKWEGPYEVT
nr:reverse transcriptase domain-containing protein [Tanacetum cinerariifolium]